jgi:hypothetical protein
MLKYQALQMFSSIRSVILAGSGALGGTPRRFPGSHGDVEFAVVERIHWQPLLATIVPHPA